MTQLQAAIIGYAREKIGVHETAPNSGPEIDGWLALRGCEPGLPWCAAFACAAVEVGADECATPLATFHPSASTQRLWAANQALQTQDPQPGDLYVLRHTASTGHTGIVETVENGAVGSEISGNTFADGGGREGNCVARHFGPPEKIHGGVLLGYLRPA
jgi:hypothetical protein